MTPSAISIIDAQTLYAAFAERLVEYWQTELRNEAREARQEREDRLSCEQEVHCG